MIWPSKAEIEWGIFLKAFESLPHGLFLIRYDRIFTKEAILGRIEYEFGVNHWDYIYIQIEDGHVYERIKNELSQSPAKAVIIGTENATSQNFYTLNFEREDLNTLQTNVIFLISRKDYPLLHRSAVDVTTWFRLFYSFELPKIDIIPLQDLNSVAKTDFSSPALYEKYRYFCKMLIGKIDPGNPDYDLGRILPQVADLFLDDRSYCKSINIYNSLVDHYELGYDRLMANIMKERLEIVLGWELIFNIHPPNISSEDREKLQRIFDKGLFDIQKDKDLLFIKDKREHREVISKDVWRLIESLIKSNTSLSEDEALTDHEATFNRSTWGKTLLKFAQSKNQVEIGILRMRFETAERRDFLPDFFGRLARYGAMVSLEHGYGSGMNFGETDYLEANPAIMFKPRDDILASPYVLCVRYPGDSEVSLLRPGSCLISMLNPRYYPERVSILRAFKVVAIALDMIVDDSGRKLVENDKATAWNGIETAFQVLKTTYPNSKSAHSDLNPIKVTILGSGSIASHAMQAAFHYGRNVITNDTLNLEQKTSHVQVTTLNYDHAPRKHEIQTVLENTDILANASVRDDLSLPIIPNDWINYLPAHSIILDLTIDPNNCELSPPYIKAIEGIPDANLDQYIFSPNDPIFDTIPNCVHTSNRRFTITCMEWPGMYPKQCMEIFGRQIQPLLRKLIEKNGINNIDPQGGFFERALARSIFP